MTIRAFWAASIVDRPSSLALSRPFPSLFPLHFFRTFPPMKVLKFGGSSLSTPERIRDAVRIALKASKRERVVVVVSAFQGITNQLLECSRLAAAGDA